MVKHVFLGSLGFILSLPGSVFAQAPAAKQAPGFAESLVSMLPMFVIVFFIFYFLVLRPQEKRMKEHEKLMTDLKRGDEVVTTSGFLGRVVGVDEECVTVELANNVRVRVLRNFISSKVDRSSATGEKKKAAS